MVGLVYEKVSETKAKVITRYFQVSDREESPEENFIIVDFVPEPETGIGKSPTLYIDVETRELWYEYANRSLNVEEEIIVLKENNVSATERYEAAQKETTPIEVLKELKLNALKEQCTQAIYTGFTSGDNEFGYNDQDQANFTKRMVTIVAGSPGPFKWKTKNNGVVELTKTEFMQVVTEAEGHQLEQQEKYWALEEEVLAASTNEEVDSVNW